MHKITLNNTSAFGLIDAIKLTDEIKAVANSVIGIEVGPSIIITSTDLLTNEATVAIEQVITNHDGRSITWALTGDVRSKQQIENIIFDVLPIWGLYKKVILVEGEVDRIEYYKTVVDPATQTYANLAIVERRTYLRMPNPPYAAYARTLEIDYYDVDGNLKHTKVCPIKYYDAQTSMDELRRKRSNLISEAELFVLGYFNAVYPVEAMDYATNLVDLWAIEKSKYIQGNGEHLNTAITNCTLPYVSQFLKDSLLNIINYEYIPI